MFEIIITFSVLILGTLGLGALSGIFSERVGVVNIAINGMMIIGGVIYSYFSKYLHDQYDQIALLLLAGVAGGAFALLHGFATIKLKADHVISGVAINLLAPAIALFLMKLQGDSNKIQVMLRDLSLFDLKEGGGSYKSLVSLSLFITVALFIVAWFALNRTKWGLRLRSVGENPNAADAVGINVNGYKFQGVFISGTLAGLAGAMYVQYSGYFLGNVQGLGFLALAIMIMGQWRVSFAAIAAIVFTLIYSTTYAIDTGAGTGSIFKWLKENTDVSHTIPYVLTIITLALSSRGTLAPKSVGLHFDKSKR